jgi:hypothetical protein
VHYKKDAPAGNRNNLQVYTGPISTRTGLNYNVFTGSENLIRDGASGGGNFTLIGDIPYLIGVTQASGNLDGEYFYRFLAVVLR